MATLSTVISYGEPTGTIVTEIGTPGPTGQTGPQGPAGPTFTGGPITSAITYTSGNTSTVFENGDIYTEDNTSGAYGVVYINGLEASDGTNTITMSSSGIQFPDSTVQSTGFPGSSAFYPSTGNPSGFLTAASLSGYATQSWVTSQGYATQSYVNGQGFITSSALTPYLLSSTAASTYQTISGMSAYLSKVGNLSGLSNTATARTNLGLGTMATQTASNYLTVSAAAAGYYPLSGNPSGFITASALTGYATESFVTSQGYITQGTADGLYYPLSGNPSAFLTDAPSDGSQYARQDGAWSVVTGGGGGSYLPLAGGTMTGAIVFDGTSGQYINKGNFDTSRGGNYGISLVCSIGYEFNWQAGWLTTTNQGSVTPRPLYLDSLAGTTLRVWNSATDTGVEVAHTGITFLDSTVQSSAAFVPGSGNLDMAGYDITNANFNSSAGQVSAQNVTMSSGGVLTFGDATVQTTASPVGEAPQDGQMYARVDGIWLPIPGTPTFTRIATGISSISGWSYAGTNLYIGSNGNLLADTPSAVTTFNQNGGDTSATIYDLSSMTGLTNIYFGYITRSSATTPPVLYASAPLTTFTMIGDFTDIPAALSGYTGLTNIAIQAPVSSIPSFSTYASIQTVNLIGIATTSAPSFSGCTLLSDAEITSCAMTSAPSFSGCTSLTTVYINNNAAMTAGPDFTNCTSLTTADCYHGNSAMITAPNYTNCTSIPSIYITDTSLTSLNDFPVIDGCSSLSGVYIQGLPAFSANLTNVVQSGTLAVYLNSLAYASGPVFTNCTINSVSISGNYSMTSAPSFIGCTIYSIDVNGNTSMTSAPNFSALSSLNSGSVYNNAAMTSAPDFSGCTSLTNIYITNNAAMTSAPDFTTITQSGIQIYLNNCAISDCTTPLDQLDAGGGVAGYIDLSGGTNQSIDPTYYSLLSLQAKGWTVVFNSL